MARWKVFELLRMLRLRNMKQALDSIPEQQVCLQDQPAHASSSDMQGAGKEKMDYLSNLKVLLTALVILHHTAIAYGGAGQLIYHSPSHPPGSQEALVMFNAVNQSFFMATFFFIAGFLSRKSLDRRVERNDLAGLASFVKERGWRLGVPTALYSLLGPVVYEFVIAIGRGDWVGWGDAWEYVRSLRGVRGPVWFCALLLIFDLLFSAFWLLKETVWQYFVVGNRILLAENDEALDKPKSASVSGLRLHIALSLLTTIDFLWRLAFPVGGIFVSLNLNLGYLPQYIAAYSFGVMMPDPMHAISRVPILLALGAMSTISGTMLMSTMSARLAKDGRDPTSGGLNTAAAAYAIWNNFTGYLITSGLLRLFYDYISTPWKAISSLAYTAFLLHIPVSTAIEISLKSWQTLPVVKTICVGLLNVVASWAAAWLWDAMGSMLWHKMIAVPTEAVRRHSSTVRRRRTTSRGECAIEILEGLDEVGR